MPDTSWQQGFEQAWAFREERLYPALFGTLGPGIYPLDAELFKKGFRQERIDPRWLHHGVFECPPNQKRSSWLYVSSGLSNAWEESSPARDWSGLGCEFLIQSREQSRWALLLLRRMVAFQILLSCERFPGKGLLKAWDRIPLRAPIDASSSRLNWTLLTPAGEFPGPHQLPTGRFEFIQFIGVTEDEAEYARRNGGAELLALFKRHGIDTVTQPARGSVFGADGRSEGS